MPLNTELWLHPEAFASSAILVSAATVEIHNRPVFAVTGVREEQESRSREAAGRWNWPEAQEKEWQKKVTYRNQSESR
jgi:hypothetical protein